MSGNPLLSIWFRPRETIREVLSQHPGLYVIPIFCIVGISQSLDRSSLRSLGDTVPLTTILIVSVLIGPLGGLFSMWLWSHLVRFSGNLMGGSADRTTLKTALAWGLVPIALQAFLWIPDLILVGADMFTSETPRLDENPGIALYLLTSVGIQVGLIVWAGFSLSNTVAEVQGFRSAWAGFGNLVLSLLVVLIPLLVVVGFAIALRSGG